MSFNLNSLWLDWRAKVPDGTPNPSNAYHLVLLKELCFKQGIDKDIIDNVILILEKDDGGLDDKEKEKAKAKGLVSKGYGNWGPEDGDTTHKNVDGKLTPIGDDDEEEKEPTKPMKIDPNPFDKEDEEDKEGGEKGDTEESQTKIPTEQMKYYEVESQKESKPLDEEGASRAERGRRARVIYSKLQLVAAGKDVELNETDIKNLGSLRISGNARSGQLYVGDALDKGSGLKSASAKSPHYADRNIHKNELLRNWDKVEAKLDELGVKERPKFKQGVGYLTDKPPVVDHDPVSMKPNAILEKVPTSKGSDLLSDETRRDIEKNQGVSLGEDEFFGKRLDPNNPQTFVDNIKFVIDATGDYISDSADEKTKKYFKGFVKDLSGLIDGDDPPKEKLEKIRSVIKEEYSELVHSAMELSDDEGRNVLKDYGELATYMLYLSEGKETYLPKSGNYPLADIVVVDRDEETGEALTIEGYSIKSQRGKEQQPGSSATEFLKHFSNVHLKHKKKFKSLQALHKGSVEDVKLDEIEDEEMLDDLKKIRSVENVDSIDEMKDIAKELFDKFGDGDEKLENFMKKVDRFYEKKAKKYDIKYDMQGMGKAAIELLHREYSGMKTLSDMKELNLPSKLKFIEVVVGDKDVDIREKGKEFTTSDFGLHDKGYLPLNDANVEKEPPPPRVGKIRYASANLALRTKKY